jgi:hypothetical protein
MQRRALLAALPSVLAGCSIAPAGPSTTAYPASQPNIFIASQWDGTGSELTVRFERGNRLTPANTGMLAVVTVGDTRNRTVWVATDEIADSGDPRDEFPLSPGARVTHEVSQTAHTRLLWVGPDGERTRSVASWAPPTATGTETPESGSTTTATTTARSE